MSRSLVISSKKEMNERISEIEYNGREILILDYSNLRNSSEIVNWTKKGLWHIHSAHRKDLRILVDITNSYFHGDGYRALRDFSTESRQHSINDAFIGVNGIAQRVLLEAIDLWRDTKIHIFDSRKEALEFLTSD